MTRISIWASGSGSNADRLVRYFADHSHVSISQLCTNRADAYVLQRAKEWSGVDVHVFNKKELNDADEVLSILHNHKIDYIILAGFLWKIPEHIITAYPKRIINIHPSLLPKFGGKGMYGTNVHRAVLAAKEPTSGITIHYVNEVYDDGEVIFQASTDVSPTDTIETLASKIQKLEHTYFPEVVWNEIKNNSSKNK